MGMKVALVHQAAVQGERDWANQFAGNVKELVDKWGTVVNFRERSRKVFSVPSLTWASIVATVADAAKEAGAGGTVVVVSGHGGAAFDAQKNVVLGAGIVIWDPTQGDVSLNWRPNSFASGLFWDEELIGYDQSSQGPSQKDVDLDNISKDGSPNKIDTAHRKARLEAFDAQTRIGAALKANKVKRLSLTCCTVGAATTYISNLAKQLGVEVAAFNQKTEVMDDTQYDNSVQGKWRLILEADDSQNNNGTNTERARVQAPDLDNKTIAFVGHP